MPVPMEVTLPQTMLQKLLDLLKSESFRQRQEMAIQKANKNNTVCDELPVIVGLLVCKNRGEKLTKSK